MNAPKFEIGDLVLCFEPGIVTIVNICGIAYCKNGILQGERTAGGACLIITTLSGEKINYTGWIYDVGRSQDPEYRPAAREPYLRKIEDEDPDADVIVEDEELEVTI